MDRTKLFCWLDDWGNYLGAIFVVAPMLWDVIFTGFRGFFEWNIDTWGVVSQLLGVGIVLLTRWARKVW